MLTTAAFDMFMSKYDEDVVAASKAASAAAEKQSAEAAVQGLTQMFYLEEKDEQSALASARSVAGAGTVSDAAKAGASAAVGVQAASEQPWPVGLSQMFFVEDAHEEAEAAAGGALPLAPRSFLRERLGVPGEVVQALRQVSFACLLEARYEKKWGRGSCRFFRGILPDIVVECGDGCLNALVTEK